MKMKRGSHLIHLIGITGTDDGAEEHSIDTNVFYTRSILTDFKKGGVFHSTVYIYFYLYTQNKYKSYAITPTFANRF